MLRFGKGQRSWLDAHNVTAVIALPFHLMIALTSVGFALHTPFYYTQAKALYGGEIDWGEHAPPPTGAAMLPAHQLLDRVHAQLPGFDVHNFTFQQNRQGQLEANVVGLDIRRGARGRTWMQTPLDPYTGTVDPHDLPGHMDGWGETVNAFFALHFGSFGGNAVRWLYVLMGLAGAALFHTGNVLWIESRRRKQRGAETVAQKRSARILGCLTVGISLGSVAGISATIAAAKWLPTLVQDLAFWHQAIYYAIFFAAIGWAFLRGTARGAVELLWASAVLTLAIPLTSLAGVWGVGGSWSHPQSWPVDVSALIAVPVMLYIAQRTRRRMHQGHADSIWAQGRG